MKEKNYNLELVRVISFILVIVIHVTNYFCRAYGRIPQGEYLFSLALDTVARLSVPCFFMISGALLLGREEPMQKAAPLSSRTGCVERGILFLERMVYGDRV